MTSRPWVRALALLRMGTSVGARGKPLSRYGCVHPQARPDGSAFWGFASASACPKRAHFDRMTVTPEQQVVADTTGKIGVKAPTTSAVAGRERMTQWRQRGRA